MSDKSHNYELAFHILPNLEESKLAEIKLELENLVTSNEGVIAYSRIPERTRLSYPINHNRSSYFGFIHFSLPNPDNTLKNMSDQLSLNNNLLRSLIIKMPSDLQKGKDMLRQIKMRERTERKPKAAPRPQVTEEEQNKLDEQLEDIIGKL